MTESCAAGSYADAMTSPVVPVDVSPRPGAAERLRRMIELPTVSAEVAERGMRPFEDFIALLPELYPLVHARLERERITDIGLLYRWRGATATDPVVLMAHFDVVPVDESDAWTHPPFSGQLADGFVHGRGALDDKGPMLVILEAVENLLAAGFTPPRDVYLSFGGDEEVFGAAGQTIAATFRDRGITPWLVLDEGGAVVDAPLPFVSGTAAVIGVGEKGMMTVHLTARGDAGHSSAPPKMTAVGRIARAVTRLRPTTFTPRPPRALSTMLRLFAVRAAFPARLLLRGLAAMPWLTGRIFALLGGEPAAIVRTTVAATMQSGGTAANVLPSEARAVVNLRIAVGESPDSVRRRVVRRIADNQVSVTVAEASAPSPESATDNAQFALLARAVASSHPHALAVPYVMMAGTDSRHFHAFSPAVYRFAPLAMNAEARASIHGVNERVSVAELERGEIFHRTLLTSLS